jgi:hypothetical protein
MSPGMNKKEGVKSGAPSFFVFNDLKKTTAQAAIFARL